MTTKWAALSIAVCLGMTACAFKAGRAPYDPGAQPTSVVFCDIIMNEICVDEDDWNVGLEGSLSEGKVKLSIGGSEKCGTGQLNGFLFACDADKGCPVCVDPADVGVGRRFASFRDLCIAYCRSVPPVNVSNIVFVDDFSAEECPSRSSQNAALAIGLVNNVCVNGVLDEALFRERTRMPSGGGSAGASGADGGTLQSPGEASGPAAMVSIKPGGGFQLIASTPTGDTTVNTQARGGLVVLTPPNGELRQGEAPFIRYGLDFLAAHLDNFQLGGHTFSNVEMRLNGRISIFTDTGNLRTFFLPPETLVDVAMVVDGGRTSLFRFQPMKDASGVIDLAKKTFSLQGQFENTFEVEVTGIGVPVPVRGSFTFSGPIELDSDGDLIPDGQENCTTTDRVPPVFTVVPAPITISSCKAPNIGAPQAVDLCSGPVTITSNRPANFPLGTTLVTWRATDRAGNVAVVTQTVTAVLGDDASCCPVGTKVIRGTGSGDNLVGTSGSDCIFGLEGNDTIDGRGGNDFISGGGGQDVLLGGSGHDYLSGGEGDDQLTGDDGDDVLIGGNGQDVLRGMAGNDRHWGAGGDDRVFGGEGDDTLLGGQGQDQLRGEGGNDTIGGEDGDDLLEGGAGNDALNGGADHDRCLDADPGTIFTACND